VTLRPFCGWKRPLVFMKCVRVESVVRLGGDHQCGDGFLISFLGRRVDVP